MNLQFDYNINSVLVKFWQIESVALDRFSQSEIDIPNVLLWKFH